MDYKWREKMDYGWRGKIGLIYPSPGAAGEIELHQMAPEGVAIFTTRILLEETTPEGLIKIAGYAEQAASLLASAKVNLIIFCCTAGSLIKGIGSDKEIIARIESHTGIAAITTATAVVQGLHALKAKKVVVATPYIDAVNQREKAFMEDSGFEITSIKGLPELDPKDPSLQHVRPEQMYRLVKEIFSEEADTIFISCTGLRVIDIIEPLEMDLKRPVVTSIQATMWAALRKINVQGKIEGLGKLFRM